MPALHRFRTPARPHGAPAPRVARPTAAGAPRARFGFDDRRAAGRVLADWLAPVEQDDAVVVAIAGGGVEVGEEVARAFALPLDVLVAEPLSLPGFGAAQLGAVAEDGVMTLDAELATQLGAPCDALLDAAADRRTAIARRAYAWRAGAPGLALAGRTAFLVDEALDGGIVAATAADALRRRGAARVIVAAPLADRPSVRRVGLAADEVVAVLVPGSAGPRAGWYRNLPPVAEAAPARHAAAR